MHQVNSPAAGKYKPAQGGSEFRSHHREPTSLTRKEMLLKCYAASEEAKAGQAFGVGWGGSLHRGHPWGCVNYWHSLFFIDS